MEALKNRIAKMSNDQLVAIRAHFDSIVDVPKNHPDEFRVLVALNIECHNRGLEWQK